MKRHCRVSVAVLGVALSTLATLAHAQPGVLAYVGDVYDEASCVAVFPGATWKGFPGPRECIVTADGVIPQQQTLTITEITVEFRGRVVVGGTLNVVKPYLFPAGTLRVTGSLVTIGDMEVRGTLENFNRIEHRMGTVTIRPYNERQGNTDVFDVSGGRVINHGRIDNYTIYDLSSFGWEVGGQLENSGYFINHGDASLHADGASIVNTGDFDNFGYVNVANALKSIFSGEVWEGHFYNEAGAEVYNDGTFDIFTGEFRNAGTVFEGCHAHHVSGGIWNVGYGERIDVCGAWPRPSRLTRRFCEYTLGAVWSVISSTCVVGSGEPPPGRIRRGWSFDDKGVLTFEGMLEIDAGTTLRSYFVNKGVIVNFGRLDSFRLNEATGRIVNRGTIAINDHADVPVNRGVIVNEGTFQNATHWFFNQGAIENSGRLDNSGDFENSADGTIRNTGAITNAGAFTNLGTIDSSIDDTSTLLNEHSGTLVNAGLLFTIERAEASGEIITNLTNHGRIFNVLNGNTCRGEGEPGGLPISIDSPFFIFGRWDVLTRACTAGFLADLSVQTITIRPGFHLQIDSGVTLINRGTLAVEGEVENSGRLINRSVFVNGFRRFRSGEVHVHGRITSSGTITTELSAGLFIRAGGTIATSGTVNVLTSSGLGIAPGGTLVTSGTINIDAASSVSTSGTITNSGTISNRGSIDTGNTLGTIVNTGAGSVVNEDEGTTNGERGTLSGTIGATTIVLGGVTCASLGGTWTEAARSCVLGPGVVSIAQARILQIDGGVTLDSRAEIHVDGAIVSRGAIVSHHSLLIGHGNGLGFVTIEDGGVVLNYGVIRTRQGSSTFVNRGSITNAARGLVEVLGAFANASVFTNFGRVENLGRFDNAGTITNTCAGAFTSASHAAFTGNPPVAAGCDSPSPLEPTVTAVTAAPNPSSLGQVVTLTATVAPATATGIVIFHDGDNALGEGALEQGTASLITTNLGAGVRSVTARYGGDGAHGPSISAPALQAVSESGSTPVSAAIADLDGDGLADLAVANLGSDTVAILRGNGQGAFERSIAYAVDRSPVSVATADVNADGHADLIVAGLRIARVAVLLGRGDGTFAAPATYATAFGPLFVAIADLDRDGHADLVVANGPLAGVLRGIGDGTFRPIVNYFTGARARSIAVADFNGDGVSDLAVANEIARNLSVLLGNADGTFQPRSDFGSFERPTSIAASDFNGDGRADLVIANYGASSAGTALSVLSGNGDGTFQQARSHGAGMGAISVAVGDFNDDGRDDVAVANESSNTVSVLHGRGDGTFQTSVDYGVGSHPSSVTAGDINADGVTDIVVTNSGSNDLSVLLGVSIAPDLTVTKTHSGIFKQGVTGASYTITVSNAGRGPTTDPVTVADILPAGLAAIEIEGRDWTCTLATLSCERSDTLASGASYPAIVVTVAVADDAPSSITNTATVMGGADRNASNNTASDTTAVLQKPTLTVTADDATRKYGESNPVFTGTISGLEGNDDITATYASDAGAGNPVGIYTIVPTLVDPNGRLARYRVAAISGQLTVTRAPLTIKADDTTKLAGDPVPALTARYTGFVNGDDASMLQPPAVLTTTATQLSPAGVYPITVQGGGHPNYLVTAVNATLTVVAARVPPVPAARDLFEQLAADPVLAEKRARELRQVAKWFDRSKPAKICYTLDNLLRSIPRMRAHSEAARQAWMDQIRVVSAAFACAP